jgi:hypothetical protein
MKGGDGDESEGEGEVKMTIGFIWTPEQIVT